VEKLTIDPSISGPLLVTILVFLLVIGSFFSMGVLRFFQQRVKSGITFMVSTAVSIAIFVYMVNLLG
jgi:hypothetical protein